MINQTTLLFLLSRFYLPWTHATFFLPVPDHGTLGSGSIRRIFYPFFRSLSVPCTLYVHTSTYIQTQIQNKVRPLAHPPDSAPPQSKPQHPIPSPILQLTDQTRQANQRLARLLPHGSRHTGRTGRASTRTGLVKRLG